MYVSVLIRGVDVMITIFGDFDQFLRFWKMHLKLICANCRMLAQNRQIFATIFGGYIYRIVTLTPSLVFPLSIGV
jgi:hypothetical protein